MSGETFSFVIGTVEVPSPGECVWTIYRGEARDLARCRRPSGRVVGGYEAGVVHGWLWRIRASVQRHSIEVQGRKWVGFWSDMEVVIAGETVTLVSKGLRFGFDDLCRMGVLDADDWSIRQYLIDLAKELMSAWTPPQLAQFRAQRAALEAAERRAHG